jgi:predicted phage-related endonuclease
VIHPRYKWLSATVDGFVYESAVGQMGDPIGVLEVKTTGAAPWDEIPAHYQAQAQVQMACTGLPQVWFATLHGRRLRTYELPADPGDQAFIIKRAYDFWSRYVERKALPPPDGSAATLSALSTVYPNSSPDSIPLDAIADEVDAWRGAKRFIRDLEAQRDGAEAAIKAALGDASEGTVNGQRVVTWRTQTRRSIDAGALRNAHPNIAAEFTVERTYRVMREGK